MRARGRLARLEAAAGRAQQESRDDARRRRVMDRMYHAVANARREIAGLDPLACPPELRETREDVLRTLRETIPHYRQHGGWRYGEGAEFLQAWENRELEKLSELQKGDA